MSLTMNEYDPVYCDGNYCPKDCDGCKYREENREDEDGNGIHLRPGEERRVPKTALLVERRGVQDHETEGVRGGR